MARFAAIWRRAAHLLAACLLAVLVAGPCLDAVVCQSDGIAAPAHNGAAVAVVANPGGGPSDSHDGPGFCSHGHPHVGASIVQPACELAVVLTPARAAFSAPLEPLLAGLGAAGIERPPRA